MTQGDAGRAFEPFQNRFRRIRLLGQAPHAWFTAFAPADAPRVAVAVIVEHGGNAGNEATGGRVAAPIAKAVIEAVLGS